MANFLPLQKLEVASNTYPGPASIVAGFTPNGWAFVHDGNSAADIYASFDGVIDHVIIRDGIPVSYACGATSVWFRRASDAPGVERVLAMATGT